MPHIRDFTDNTTTTTGANTFFEHISGMVVLIDCLNVPLNG